MSKKHWNKLKKDSTIDKEKKRRSKKLKEKREVAAILNSIADFHQDRDLTPVQAATLDAAVARPPVKIKARDLPSRKRK